MKVNNPKDEYFKFKLRNLIKQLILEETKPILIKKAAK